MGRKPQLWLKDGDVVEVGLENVGTWYVSLHDLAFFFPALSFSFSPRGVLY